MKWYKDMLGGMVFAAVLVLLMVLQMLGVIDLSGLVDTLTAYGDRVWMPVVLVGLMTVMYAFALPASTLMLAAGVMYAPVWATTWSTLGGVLGGVAAYMLVERLSRERIERYTKSHFYKRLQTHAGLGELTALRVMPGFPHSVINYSAGLLHVPLPVFLLSSTMGHAVKAYVYTSAMHAATHVDADASFSWATVWPLVLLALFLFAGAFAVRARHQRG